MLKGRFYIKGSNQLHTLVRFHSDGSLDSSFNFRNQAIDTTSLNLAVVLTTEMTEDKGYLVGGNFNKFQGYVKRSIAKLDSNGRVEPQYFTSMGPDSSALFGNQLSQVIIIKKSDFGGYYVGGDFLKWDGQPSQPIIRIHGLQSGVGLAELSKKSQKIKLYPNPSSGEFYLETTSKLRSIQLFDIKGRFIQEYSPIKSSWHLPEEKGIYLLRMQDHEGEFQFQKIVRQ
jgi:hypothetical protein